MLSIYCKFIKILSKTKLSYFIILAFFYLSTACQFFIPQREDLNANDSLTKAIAFIEIHDYAKALPLLKETVEAKNNDSVIAELYMAYCFDQTAQSEKAILFAQNFLSEKVSLKNFSNFQLKAQLIILKNKFRLHSPDVQLYSQQVKQDILFLQNSNKLNYVKDIFYSFKWVYNFNCGSFDDCHRQLLFLKETQFYLYALVEKNTTEAEAASQLLITSYQSFIDLSQSHFFKKTEKNDLNTLLIKSIDYAFSFKLPDDAIVSQSKLSSLEKKLQALKSELMGKNIL